MPILISLTLSGDERTLIVNANHIEEIIASVGEDEDPDDFVPGNKSNTTLVFVKGRPTVRVKETPEQITHMIKDSTINVVTDIANRLNAMGFIH